MFWKYPLMQEVESAYRPTVSLENVLVLACQHLLGSQYRMFQGLIQMGLRPGNLIVIGKNYSANQRVVADLRRQGVVVAPFSTMFSPLQSFDSWFKFQLQEYLTDLDRRRSLESFDKVIVLDDGGHLHEACHELFGHLSNLTGIEQTSSGYHRVRSLELAYPVTSVAKWYSKQVLEAPHIAEHGVGHIDRHLRSRRKKNPHILVFGLGTIGRQVAASLALKGYLVTGTDIKPSLLSTEYGATRVLHERGAVASYPDAQMKLGDFDVIIGATGWTILEAEDIGRLHPEASLISISSSDREFPAAAFRHQSSKLHDTCRLGGRCLVNAGFPITFDGGYHAVDPRKIEITVASLQLAVLNSVSTQPNLLPHIRERIQTDWLAHSQN